MVQNKALELLNNNVVLICAWPSFRIFFCLNFDSREVKADTDLINRLNIGQELAYLIRYNLKLKICLQHTRKKRKTNEF